MESVSNFPESAWSMWTTPASEGRLSLEMKEFFEQTSYRVKSLHKIKYLVHSCSCIYLLLDCLWVRKASFFLPSTESFFQNLKVLSCPSSRKKSSISSVKSLYVYVMFHGKQSKNAENTEAQSIGLKFNIFCSMK